MGPLAPVRRSPEPPHRPAMISAAMLIAVSSGVRAPRSSPIGEDSLASWGPEVPHDFVHNYEKDEQPFDPARPAAEPEPAHA